MPEPETSAIGTTKVVHSNYRVYYASKIDAVAALETGGYVFAMLNNIYLCDAYGVVVDRRIQGRTTNLCSVPGMFFKRRRNLIELEFYMLTAATEISSAIEGSLRTDFRLSST